MEQQNKKESRKPSSPHCRYCGEPIKAGQLLCPACGAEQAPDARIVEPSHAAKFFGVLAGSLLVASPNILAFWLYTEGLVIQALLVAMVGTVLAIGATAVAILPRLERRVVLKRASARTKILFRRTATPSISAFFRLMSRVGLFLGTIVGMAVLDHFLGTDGLLAVPTFIGLGVALGVLYIRGIQEKGAKRQKRATNKRDEKRTHRLDNPSIDG